MGIGIKIFKYNSIWGFQYGTFIKKMLDEIMNKVDLKEAKHGPFVHISHFQDLNGKFYKMK
jgi:hypothetical protein